MNNLKWIFILSILLSLQSCEDESTNPSVGYDGSGYSIKGILVCNSMPLDSAVVSLNNIDSLTTTSGSDGGFVIKNIPGGNYLLHIEKRYPDSSYMTESFNLTVRGNNYLDTLIISKAAFLFDPLLVNQNSVKLTWSSSDADDFKEYKLFRNTSPKLNENTGTLVYTSTSVSDTEFTDNNINFAVAFYRVCVNNDTSTITGSNTALFTHFSFPLDVGNKFYYQVESWGYGGFYGQINEIVDTLADGERVILVKKFYPDHIYEQTEYWLFENNKLLSGGFPGYVDYTIFDGNLVLDTCWTPNIDFLECYNNFYNNILGQYTYCQLHYKGGYAPLVYSRDSTFIANNIGVYHEFGENLDGRVIRSLIGYIDNGVLIGDTVLSNNNRP